MTRRMDRGRWTRGLVALIALLLPAATAAAPQNEFRWTGQIAAGQTVEIRGVSGSIKAAPSASGQIELVATKQGRRSDPGEVKIETVPHAGGVTICAVYPTPPDADEQNRCAPGDAARLGSRNNDVRVDFTIGIPKGVHLVARTVNGSIDIRELDGRVDAATVNGGVQFDTRAAGRAKTVNGSITGRLGRADWTDTLEMETVNGSITLDLPETIDADVEAKTVNGRITSDLPLTLKEMSRRSLKGTLGNGGRRLSLGTVNGSIALRRGA